MSKKILIVLLGAIGDVTRGLSVAMCLKRAWPECRISWAVEPASRVLVENHPAIDRVVLFERPRGLLGYRDFIRALQQEEYDLVLDMQRHFKSGLSSFLSRGKERLGFHRRNAKEFNWLFNTRQIEHVEEFSPKLQQYQNFPKALGLDTSKIEFGLQASRESREKVEALIRDSGCSRDATGFACLLLGSTWPSRLWKGVCYAELIEELWTRWGIVSILVGGPHEREFAAEICSRCESSRLVDLTGKTSLRDLLAVFEKASLAIGSDSGPMHIASTLGLPIVSLWGSTSPVRSAPFGSEDHVIQSAIGCSPCFRKNCPGLGNLCMSEIPTAAVLAHVEQIQERRLGNERR